MSGNLFKNPCNMHPLFWWENCRWLVPGLGMWVIGPGQDTSMLQSIWYTPWFSQELWKHRQLRLVSGCNVYFHCSPFLEHHLSPKSQGRVVLGFSLTPNMWCRYQQHPTPQTPRVCNKSSMELLQILQVEGSKLLSSDGSHEVLSQSSLWPNT